MAEEEEKKSEEEKTEEQEEKKEEGDAALAAPSKLKAAQQTVKDMEAATEKMNASLDRAEALKAEGVISGLAEAGAVPQKVSKEQAIKDRANKKLEKTGLKI